MSNKNICFGKLQFIIFLFCIVTAFIISFNFFLLNKSYSFKSKASTSSSTLHSTGQYIVGGNKVSSSKWPFMALVINLEQFSYTKVQSNDQSISEYKTNLATLDYTSMDYCGGTLIDNNIVLTAKHCVNDNIGKYAVIFGVSDLTQTINNKDRYILEVKKVILHPNSSNSENQHSSYLNNDIALLQLGDNLITRKKPIYMPKSISLNINKSLELEKKPGLYLGYGFTENDYTPPFTDDRLLREVPVPIFSNNRALRKMWQNPNRKDGFSLILDTNILAGFPQGHGSSCRFDSGGPLIQWDGYKWVQSGVISSGTSNDCSGVGINMRISKYISWINQNRIWINGTNSGNKDTNNIFIGTAPIFNDEFNYRLNEFELDDQMFYKSNKE